jgi:hypothetical protein
MPFRNGRTDHICAGQTTMTNSNLISQCQSPAGISGLTRSSRQAVAMPVSVISPAQISQG